MQKIDTKALSKALSEAKIPTELSKPDNFLSIGNYALNFIISGNFRKSIPNRRQIMLCGPSGSGKSYIAMNIAKLAQDQGYFVVVIDTERALDEPYLAKIGMNTDEDSFMPLQVASLEGCAKAVSLVFQNTAPDDKVCLVIDSLGNLDTEDSLALFDKKGELKNDMGLKAKKTKQLIRDINVHAGTRDMFVVTCNHVYENQNPMDGTGKYKISGGPSTQFIPSISLMLDKKKLFEDDKGDDSDKQKKKPVLGIRMTAEVLKTRFFRYAGKTELEVPFHTGMDPLSGFLEFAKSEGLVELKGAWYNYTDKAGKAQKFYAKDLNDHIENLLSLHDDAIVEREEQQESTT